MRVENLKQLQGLNETLFRTKRSTRFLCFKETVYTFIEGTLFRFNFHKCLSSYNYLGLPFPRLDALTLILVNEPSHS